MRSTHRKGSRTKETGMNETRGALFFKQARPKRPLKLDGISNQTLSDISQTESSTFAD